MTRQYREIDVLMIFHKYDNKPIIVTVPFIYEQFEGDLKHHFGDKYKQVTDFKQKCSKSLLRELQRQIAKNSKYVPDVPQSLHQMDNSGGGIMQTIDQTNRYPVGKILLEIHDIQNFEWEGEGQNL